jgi:hypothetical protein
VGSLFDDDQDVEIASIRSHRSRGYSASSGASRPPTSESDGIFDGQYGLGEDEGDDEGGDAELSSRPSKQRTRVASRVGLSKRDAALKSEVRSFFNSSFV